MCERASGKRRVLRTRRRNGAPPPRGGGGGGGALSRPGQLGLLGTLLTVLPLEGTAGARPLQSPAQVTDLTGPRRPPHVPRNGRSARCGFEAATPLAGTCCVLRLQAFRLKHSDSAWCVCVSHGADDKLSRHSRAVGAAAC